MRARYVVHITPADVGERVSVRFWLPDAAHRAGTGTGPVHSDALGHLQAWEDGLLTIRRKDGSLVEVDEALLVAGKVLPPPPTPRPRSAG